MDIEHPLSQTVEQLVDDLLCGESASKRQKAAEEIGKLSRSNKRVVAALMVARTSDTHHNVQSAASEALQAKAHQAVLETNPDLVAEEVVAARQEARQRVQRSTSRSSGWRTATVGIIGLIGVSITFAGLQEFLGDSNMLGLYCTIPTGLALIALAWVISRSGR